MSDLLTGQPLAHALGWALLQFVWQGAVLGVLTAALLFLLRRSAPDIRYVVSTIGLALMLTMPVVTAVQAVRTPADSVTGSEWSKAAPRIEAALAQSAAGVSRATTTRSSERPTPVASALTRGSWLPSRPDAASLAPWLPLLAAIWLCGVLLLSLRLASGWLWVQRMKWHRTAAAAERWQQAVRRLSRQLHISRPIRLLESSVVVVPTVIGWLRPVVLLPASALAALSPDQVEAILAHELAHIRRHDYLVNLLQTVVETLLFYHPAVWWLSRRVRVEREHCCDDLAVSLCGDPVTYAAALADLEELRGTPGRLLVAASGGSLLQRVRRLVSAPSTAGRGPGWAAGLAAVMLITGVAAGAIGNELLQRDGRIMAGPNRRVWRSDAPHLTIRPGDARAVLDVLAGAREATHELAVGAREASRALRDGAREAARSLAVGSQAARRRLEEQRLTSAGMAEMEASEPQAPAPPSPPAPPAPPAAPAGRHSNSTFSWSNGSEKVEVRVNGEVEFTDDDADVQRLSPGGSLRITDGGWFSAHVVEFRANAAGQIERRYWIGATEKPFDPEGRQWVAASLPRFIRQTALGAPARVARFLRRGGPAAVLAEISLIDGGWGKRQYFNELLKSSNLDAATRARVLAQAGREIDSDFELATLLIERTEPLIADDTTRKAYLDAARSIGSDFELRRVLGSALTRVATNSGLLATLLDTSKSIDSDFEEATLLVEVAKTDALDGAARGAFFDALSSVGSDFEHRRVLTTLAERSDLRDETMRDMLRDATSIGSDFELAAFLTQFTGRHPLTAATKDPFFRAVADIGSAFERGRVLQTLVKRQDLPDDALAAVLRATGEMHADNEASQVLQAVVARYRLTGATRDLYIDVASRLGQFEQARAIKALTN